MLITLAPAPLSAFDIASEQMPAMTDELRQLPPALHTLAPASRALGATPGIVGADPAAMPDTWVPWPLSSTPAGCGTHDPMSSTSVSTLGTTPMQLTK